MRTARADALTPGGGRASTVGGALSVLTVLMALSGCGTSLAPRATPNCEEAGRPASPAVVLMAQSVRTASLIPCMQLLPVGWQVSTVYARDGSSHFLLSSDRAGNHALDVILQRACDTHGATAAVSDEGGTARYERVLATRPSLRVDRFYTYPGGCTIYRFDLRGDQSYAAANQASLAVGFISRTAVAARVRQDSHGQLTLDPPSGGRP